MWVHFSTWRCLRLLTPRRARWLHWRCWRRLPLDAAFPPDAASMLYSVKTDAFVIKRSDLEKATGLVEFSSRIGCWRVAMKGFSIPSKKNDVLECKGMNITEFENESLKVSNEWDTDRITQENVLPFTRLMIRGFVPGTGRSHICKTMVNRGHGVLFLVPTNELGQECGCEWTTLSNFFGIAFGDEKIKKFGSSEFDVIVFDEIYFHNVGKWVLIREYERENPNKIIIVTGDTKQLKNPESISNTIPFEQYADYCKNHIFKYIIMLVNPKDLKQMKIEKNY